jgi:hypothetical protein
MTERAAQRSTSPVRSAASPASASTSAPNKQALFDAAVEVMRKQAEEQQAEEERRRREQSRSSPIIAVGLTIILAVGVYVAVERPTWIFPQAPLVESPEVQEASLRIGMATTAQRIERFRAAQGRLPRTLSEAGSSASGIVYELRPGSQYLLRGTNGSVRLTLSSTDSLRPFVGQSFQAISQRARR